MFSKIKLVKFPEGQAPRFSDYVNTANVLLGDTKLWDEMVTAKTDSFTYSGDSFGNALHVGDIRGMLRDTSVKASVRARKTVWCGSFAMAWTIIDKGEVWINSRKFGKDLGQKFWVKVLIHEYIHVLDFSTNLWFFGHGEGLFRNWRQGSAKKKQSAPIYISEYLTKNL